MPCSAVVFDLDGTILNTLDDLAQAANRVCRAHDWPTFPVSAYRSMVGNGMRKLVERFVPAALADDEKLIRCVLDEFRSCYDAHKEDHTSPYPGVLALLDGLRRATIRLAVLTNKDHTAAQQLVKRYFGDRFDVVQGVISTLPPKPAAPMTERVLEALGTAPDCTLYVGDSDVDVETGHAVGMAVAGVTWGFRGREELEASGADFLIDAPAALLRIALS